MPTRFLVRTTHATPPMRFYEICCHNKHKRSCMQCDRKNAITNAVRKCIRSAFTRKQSKKKSRSLEILGCDDWQQLAKYLSLKINTWNKKFPQKKITKNNISIDHIKPVKAFEPSELHMCNHFTNFQVLPLSINIRKGSKWTARDEKKWREHIIYKPNYSGIHLPRSFSV